MKKLLAIAVIAGLAPLALGADTTPYSMGSGGLSEDFDVMGDGTVAPGEEMGTRNYKSYWDVPVEVNWGDVQQMNDQLQYTGEDGFWPGYGAFNGGGVGENRGLGGLYINQEPMQGRMVTEIQNDTGDELTSIQVSFDYFMAWSRDDNGETVAFYVDGTAAGSEWDVTASDLGDFAHTTAYAPDDYFVTKSGEIVLPEPVAPGETFELNWDYQGEGGKMQAIGIDNLSVVPEPTTLGLLGIGGLAALIRRRRS